MGLAFAFQVRLFWVGFPAYSVGCLYIALGFHVVAVLAYFPLVILAGSTYSEDAGRGIQVALTAAFAIFSTVIAVIQLIATFILILSSGLRRVANVCNLHDELKGCGEELAELRPLTDVEANALADLYQAVGALCQDVLDGKLDRAGWLSLRWCWKARVMKRRLKENITAFTTEIVLARPSELGKTDENTSGSALATRRRAWWINE
ncbi:hypothetical protein FB451DRAFT_1238045 [Mycena latifolia]|nr:hypothetical protein FB451DRAFT_1238045 [Mycena latifolia]